MHVPNIKQFTMYLFNIAIDCDLYMIKYYVMIDVRCNWLFTINQAPPPHPTCPCSLAPSPVYVSDSSLSCYMAAVRVLVEECPVCEINQYIGELMAPYVRSIRIRKNISLSLHVQSW